MNITMADLLVRVVVGMIAGSLAGVGMIYAIFLKFQVKLLNNIEIFLTI